MVFLPLAGLVNLGATIMMIVEGSGMILIPAFLFFCALQLLLAFLAIQLDNEDKKLAIYSPFLIFWYKQICDLVMLRAFIDVLTRSKKLKWTSAQRVGAATTGQRL